MTIEELKNYLKIRLANCEKAKIKNYEKEKGLGGTIATEQGKKQDAYLNGKIAIIKDILAILEDKPS